jgi:hypothetical protein
MNDPRTDKLCVTCGRRFAWRRKWADVWDEVKFCSKGCRGGPGRLDREVEARLLEMVRARGPRATLCPSDVARDLFPDPGWRREMERVRRAGRRLAIEGRIEVTQGGRVVDFSDARGPVRYRPAPEVPS